MRFLASLPIRPSCVLLALGLAATSVPVRAADETPDPAVVGEIRAVGISPSLSAPLPAKDFDADAAPLTVNLRNHFTLEGVNPQQLVQIKTSLGTINAELLVADAPLTVANFKGYVANDATSAADKLKTYDGTFFHRAAESRDFFGQLISEFVIQGGGYRPKTVNGGINLVEIAKGDPVANEFKVANTRGTIAMAKVGPTGNNSPTPETINSATSEWFINQVDNSETLGTTNNGGFTVFARILGKGMDVADAIAALPTYNLGGAFTELPLRDVATGQTQLLLRNLVQVETVRVVPLHPPASGSGPSVLSYTVSNDNPSVATATLVNGNLTVKPGKLGGRAILTIRAQEAGGAFAESTIVATRSGPPTLVKALPALTKAKLGDTVRLHADVAAWPLSIRWEHRASSAAAWAPLADGDLYAGTATTDLVIHLAGDTAAKAGAALALDSTQFRFVVSNTINSVARTLEGAPTTLRVAPTLAFQDTLAKTTTAALGATFTLTARATGDTLPAPVYQWQRLPAGKDPRNDGDWENLINSAAASGNTPAVPSPYSGVSTSTLTVRLNGTTPAAATGISTAATVALNKSQYRCVISHDRGSGLVRQASSVTTLRVTTLPVGFAAQPPGLFGGQLGGTASVSVTSLPAASNTPVSYQWQRLPAGQNPKILSSWINLANSTTEQPTRYSGVTSRTLSISLAGTDDAAKVDVLALNDDQYRCIITNALGTATSAPALLRVVAEDFTYLTQEDNPLPGLAAAAGRTFAAAGLPKGLAIDASTGRVAGTPTGPTGLFKITVTIRDNGAVTGTRAYYLDVRNLPGNQLGGFEALLAPAADAPHSAKLAILVASNGTFTGTLVTAKDAKTLPLKGVVVRNASTGALGLTSPVTIVRAGAPAGHVYVLTNLGVNSAGVFSATVNVRDGADATPSLFGSAATGVQLASYAVANPAPWAYMGVFNIALAKPSLLAPVPEGQTAPAIPAGSGCARAPINAAGVLAITGKLPDGAPLTAKVSTGVDASYRLFARPYGTVAGGFVSSDFKLVPLSAYNPNNGGYFNRYAVPANGGEDSYWARPQGIATLPGYAAGFGPLGFNLRLEPWLFFNGTNLGLSFNANNTVATIGLAFNGPVLAAEVGLPASLKLDLAKFTFADASPPDASQLSLKLDEKTGKVTGGLVLGDGRKAAIEGFFLVPANATNAALANGTVTAEGFVTIPAAAGSSAGPTTERFRLHQAGATPAP